MTGGPLVTPTCPPPPEAAYAPLLEAIILMATDAVPVEELATAAGAPVPEVEAVLAELAAWYAATGRGFELRRVGGGWRLWTRADLAEHLGAWIVEGQQARLSQAALETLAVIAYLQPVARSRVSAVRGVNVDGVVRTLAGRGLVAESGADALSGAKLYVTTDYFLERMGLASLDDLPDLAPYLPEAADLAEELARSAASVEDDPAATDHQPTDHQPGDHQPGDHQQGDTTEENDERT